MVQSRVEQQMHNDPSEQDQPKELLFLKDQKKCVTAMLSKTSTFQSLKN